MKLNHRELRDAALSEACRADALAKTARAERPLPVAKLGNLLETRDYLLLLADKHERQI